MAVRTQGPQTTPLQDAKIVRDVVSVKEFFFFLFLTLNVTLHFSKLNIKTNFNASIIPFFHVCIQEILNKCIEEVENFVVMLKRINEARKQLQLKKSKGSRKKKVESKCYSNCFFSKNHPKCVRF